KETDAGRRVPAPPPPTIDFATHFVVAAFMGQKRSGGFAITITHVRYEAGTLVVTYRERVPPRGGFVTMALTSPYHIVKLSRQTPSGQTIPKGVPVRFEREG
ncbi:MAG: protease complex subunit PrcB family protein, partial [Deltaproteobacteria bacterium]